MNHSEGATPHAHEKLLLAVAGVFISANTLGLILIRNRPAQGLWLVGVWVACVVGGHYALNRWLPRRDPLIFPSVMLLTGWGLNLVDRLLPRYAPRQALWMVLGVLLVVGICALPGHLRWLRRYRYSWLTLGLLLLGVTIVGGVNPSGVGPRLWLGVGTFYFQPSEVLKILLVVFLASYMAEHQQIFHSAAFRMMGSLPSWRFLSPIFFMWSLCLLLLVWQRDLGTATIFFLVFILMLYSASGQALLLVGGAALLLVAAVGAAQVFDIVAFRVAIWRDPWHDADGASFQIVQSLMAIADGGLLGSGIGGGIPNFIPVVHTDFAYAAIIEEWGLLGGVGVLGVLLVIVLRGLRVALLLAHRPFHAYLAMGISVLLAVQSLMIMGGVLNLVPLTGVTLPFVSYGGSSLLASFAAVGLLLVLGGDVENSLQSS